MSAGLVRGFLYFEKSSDESPMIELSVIKMVEWNKFSFSTRVSHDVLYSSCLWSWEALGMLCGQEAGLQWMLKKTGRFVLLGAPGGVKIWKGGLDGQR